MSKLSTILGLAAVGAIALSVAPARPALAVSAELAKQCRELTIRKYPTKPAGLRDGTAQEQRTYFNQCLANQGKVDDAPASGSNPAPDAKTPG